MYFYLTPPCFPVCVFSSSQLGVHISCSAANREPMYSEAKNAARPYQTAKQQWFKSLQEAGLGTWVKKPPEQEQFLLSA